VLVSTEYQLSSTLSPRDTDGRGCAILVGICWLILHLRPEFDSPSLFCRLLDSEKGGHFSICPPNDVQFTTKQQYLPSTNILQTRYIHDEGVIDLVDFFPRPKNSNVLAKATLKQMPYREAITVQDELKKWLVRRVECIRGEMDIGMGTTWLGETVFARRQADS